MREAFGSKVEDRLHEDLDLQRVVGRCHLVASQLVPQWVAEALEHLQDFVRATLVADR